MIIIGGGAAGLAAAISAARAGAQVTILEAQNRVGKKLLKTGNGRCNLTNARVRKHDYNDSSFVERIIDAQTPEAIVDFFARIGLLVSEQGEGRVYPLSNSANSVLDVLRYACQHMGVRMLCECKATSIERTGRGFTVACEDGRMHECSNVLVATGGGTHILESVGHTIVPFVPVLCPLKTETRDIRDLSGVRAKVALRAYAIEHEDVELAHEEGEVLFREYGLSGIVTFDMSRFVEPGNWLGIDFVPQQDEEEFLECLRRRHSSICSQLGMDGKALPSFFEYMAGCFHPKVNDAIVCAAGFRSTDLVQDFMLPLIASKAKDFRLKVLEIGDKAQAQVMRGGADTSQFDRGTLESKVCPGVFAAGETLNVDGRCGGFNLHWAWASGIVAGTAAAR